MIATCNSLVIYREKRDVKKNPANLRLFCSILLRADCKLLKTVNLSMIQKARKVKSLAVVEFIGLKCDFMVKMNDCSAVWEEVGKTALLNVRNKIACRPSCWRDSRVESGLIKISASLPSIWTK